MRASLEALAAAIASDIPGDWDRMSEAQRDYWRRIAGRVVVYQHRERTAAAELAAFATQQDEAA